MPAVLRIPRQAPRGRPYTLRASHRSLLPLEDFLCIEVELDFALRG